MDQFEYIRMANRVYGKGIRHIARETGHSRRTIRKALAGWPPRYQSSKTRPSPVMDAYRGLVDCWLLEDRERPRKQRHTAKRIFDRLVADHGFGGCESTVRRYVRARKREWGLGQVEAMVPLCPQRAGEAEVDWGQAWVNMAGKPRKVHLFIMRPRQSGKPFVRAYPNEAQEMFFDGHLHAFTYFGGVFPVLIYDNLKTAVKRVFRGRQREQQHQFRAFRAHYTFEAHFCNPARGNEKGGVEGLVDYARKNLLVPIPEVADFEELNQLLLAGCERLSERRLAGREDSRSIAALFAEEQTSLMPLPTQPFAADTQWSAKVDKYQTVRVNRVRYSVPTEYVGLRVWVSQGCQKVVVRFGTKLIATHSRGFRADCWVLDPLHYLGLLERKIRAMANARPIRAWQERWPPSHDLLWRRLRERLGEREGSRAFLRVLMLYQHHPQEQVETAIAQALERGLSEVESIRPLLTGAETAQACQRLPAERLPASCPGEHEPPNPAQYDRLAGGL